MTLAITHLRLASGDTATDRTSGLVLIQPGDTAFITLGSIETVTHAARTEVAPDANYNSTDGQRGPRR
jgi:hypothetical protein